MPTYDIDEAKFRLSKLVERAAKGEPFVIATAGKPLMKVFALDAPAPSQQKRFGFMADQMKVSHDFNTIRAEEIHKLFGVRG
jgi:prevent-host-death family protein